MLKTLKKISFKEFETICLDLINRNKRCSNRKMEWLLLIKHKKLVCPISGFKVSYIGYDENKHKKGTKSFHYNFYSESGQMFTIDHIIPKSLGGKQKDITNIQPMISYFNSIKSNDLISNEDLLKLEKTQIYLNEIKEK